MVSVPLVAGVPLCWSSPPPPPRPPLSHLTPLVCFSLTQEILLYSRMGFFRGRLSGFPMSPPPREASWWQIPVSLLKEADIHGHGCQTPRVSWLNCVPMGLRTWQCHCCRRECKMSPMLVSCPHKRGSSKCHLGIFFSDKFILVHITRKVETWTWNFGVYFSVLWLTCCVACWTIRVISWVNVNTGFEIFIYGGLESCNWSQRKDFGLHIVWVCMCVFIGKSYKGKSS